MMVTIITGKINSGKSCTILKHYKETQVGDGYISVKRMHYDKVHGYDLLRLSDSSSQEFVIREDFLEPNKKVSCKIGPYVFLEETLRNVESSIKEMIQNNVTPIYLDEIGQLELYDECFNHIFSLILESNTDAVITVREDLIPKVLQKYNIENPNIITL